MLDQNFERAFSDVFGVHIEHVAMGKTTIKHPNDFFSLSMRADRAGREQRAKEQKNLPLPRGK